MNYNLCDENWIPVLHRNGQFKEIGILQALREAGQISQIAAASPLDLFALHRFLLTLIYWKAEIAEGVPQVRGLLLGGKVPPKLYHALEAEKRCFNLFDSDHPFLQDTSCRDDKTKSAGSLFSESACGTNVAHFHHGEDEAMRLCLRCAAIGMLRVIPWSQSGGQGITPSVHNAPPTMVLARGDNLAVTLGLNLIPLGVAAGTPRWTGRFVPTNGNEAIPYLEAMTWNPRRIYLGNPQITPLCWRCGQREVLGVGPIVFLKNEATKLNKKANRTIPFTWQDPAAFYGADSPYTTIKSYNESSAATGLDIVSLLDEKKSPVSAVAAANTNHRDWSLIIPCTNPANNKTFDHRQVELLDLSADSLRTAISANVPPDRSKGLDGWKGPPSAGYDGGASRFIRAAASLLTPADWAILSAAAYREMHNSPAAFDILSGLIWSLRGKVGGLPPRDVAWLVLKLMAAVPARARVLDGKPGFCPLQLLPKRQQNDCRSNRPVRSPYPLSFPSGQRLESELRAVLDRHLRHRTPEPIDWTGLCHGLNRLANNP